MSPGLSSKANARNCTQPAAETKFRIATIAVSVLWCVCTAAFCQSPCRASRVAVGRDCGDLNPLLRKRDRFAHRGTHMPSLSGSNILIVGDAPGTPELRERLIDSGANVQVVSVAGASIVIRQKQIDSAFIAASLDQATQQLCEELSELGIAQIFITPARAAPLHAAIARGVGLNGLRRKLRTHAFT